MSNRIFWTEVHLDAFAAFHNTEWENKNWSELQTQPSSVESFECAQEKKKMFFVK